LKVGGWQQTGVVGLINRISLDMAVFDPQQCLHTDLFKIPGNSGIDRITDFVVFKHIARFLVIDIKKIAHLLAI
jgi:hypothetical protein